MTDTPTAPDNKPSNLRDILVYMAGQIAEDVRANHASYDWKSSRIDEAVAAITGLVPENQQALVSKNGRTMISQRYLDGYNAAIDTTLRNFSGQTEGEGE